VVTVYQGMANEVAVQTAVFNATRHGTRDRYAFELARQRPAEAHSVTSPMRRATHGFLGRVFCGGVQRIRDVRTESLLVDALAWIGAAARKILT